MPLSRLEVLEAPVCKKKHVKSMEGFGVTWSNASVNFLPKTVVCLDMLLFVFICFKICVCVLICSSSNQLKLRACSLGKAWLRNGWVYCHYSACVPFCLACFRWLCTPFLCLMVSCTSSEVCCGQSPGFTQPNYDIIITMLEASF